MEPQPLPDDDDEDFEDAENAEDAKDTEDVDLPPELLLQQAFTGRSAVVDIDQINAQAAKHKGVSLHTMIHDGWKELAEVDFPDLPLWFEHQVCSSVSMDNMPCKMTH